MLQATWTDTTMRFLPNLGTKDSFSTWTTPEGETKHATVTLKIIIMEFCFVVLCPHRILCSGLGSTLKMRCPSWHRYLSVACKCNVRECSVLVLIFKRSKNISGGKWVSALLPPQDKELHSVAAPTPGTTGVQAQWCDEGVPGERPFTTDCHGAPPLSAGPQVTEGPAGGAALHPEAGRGQGYHQGLCQIHSETSGCHRDEKG